MKKTRNLFVLIGTEQDVQTVLDNIHFKGITILSDDNLTMEAISDAFLNNKSVVCKKSPGSSFTPIWIGVVNDINFESKANFINIAWDNIAGQFADIANKLYCDIGDHVSNSSGLTGAPKISDCTYCKYLHQQGKLQERTIYSSEHFFVLPTLGEFISGYLLIIPYNHVMSVAELDSSIQKELLTVIEDVSYILKLAYNRSAFLIWENGTGNAGRGKAKDSIVHAHIHIAPSNLTAEKIEFLSGFHFDKISTSELSNYDQHSYLLVKDGLDSWQISSNPNVYIPRQYVRQLLAEECGLTGEQWNWRTHPFKEKMMQTCYDIADALRKNWDNLPDRIKSNTEVYLKDF